LVQDFVLKALGHRGQALVRRERGFATERKERQKRYKKAGLRVRKVCCRKIRDE
jgi:hypothetical protein